MNKTAWIVIIVLIVVAIGAYVYVRTSESNRMDEGAAMHDDTTMQDEQASSTGTMMNGDAMMASSTDTMMASTSADVMMTH